MFVLDGLGGAIIVLMMFLKSVISTTSLNPIYSALLLLVAQRSFSCRNVIIEEIGKHSLNIWLLHAFLLPYVSNYKYDILVVASLLLYSYLSSLIINTISSPLENVLKKYMCK